MSSNPGCSTWAPLNTRVSPRRYSSLGCAFVRRDVEQAVVDLGVRHQPHAAAEHARVGHGDRIARRTRARSPSTVDVPARRLPAGERAQRAVEVDERAEREPRRVGDLVDVGVEARAEDPEVHAARPPTPRRCGARGRRPAARRAATGSCADPELAGEVVAAPAGQHRHHALAAAQLARHRAGEPVAAHRGRDLAGVASLRAPARARARSTSSGRRGRRSRASAARPPRRAAASRRGRRRRRVDDQADGAVHRAMRLPGGRASPCRGPARRTSRRRASAAARPRRPRSRVRGAGEHQRRVEAGAAGARHVDVERSPTASTRPGPSRSRAASYIAGLGLADHAVGLAPGGVLDGGEHRAGPRPRAVGHRERGVARGADQLGAARDRLGGDPQLVVAERRRGAPTTTTSARVANCVRLTIRRPASATWSTSACEPITNAEPPPRPASMILERGADGDHLVRATPGSRAATACARTPRVRGGRRW